MKKYIIPTVVGLMLAVSSTLFAAITYFTYSAGTALSDGVFRSDGSGNAGTVNMQSAYLDDDRLVGTIQIQAIGSGTFDANAKIVPPTSGNPTRTCWIVEGTIDSDNAGTIRLSGSDTSLRFNPVSRKLEGHGYNNGLGRVSFGDGIACRDDIVDDTEVVAIQNGTDTTNTISTTSAGFIGRVKILGNAGGNTVFDGFYGQGEKFRVSLFNTTLQRIRKNVAIFSRNLSDSQKNGTLIGDKKFYINQTSNTNARALDNDTRSLIVVGKDLIIDTNIDHSSRSSKGLIVLKDNNGNGGNIYVSSGVTLINAVIFAEGTVYSGESSVNKYNDTPSEIAILPKKQLYIFGALISRNTIGGASTSATEVFCPYNGSCTFDNATQYDLNYFRSFQSGTDSDRAYENNTLDDYSLIIEIDTRAVSNPPPGFE